MNARKGRHFLFCSSRYVRLLAHSAAAALAVTVLAALPVTVRAQEHAHEGEGGHAHEHQDEHAHSGEESGHGAHDDEHDDHGDGHHGEHGHEEAPAFSANALQQFGVAIKAAAPGRLRVSLELSGRLVPHEDRVAHVTPRYPGIIREVRKRIGDRVAPGEVVAVIESNQTLHVYEVKAGLDGTVVRRHANIGEFADDKSELFEIADYSVLSADFYAFPAEQGRIKAGQKLIIRFPDRDQTAEAAVRFLSPSTDPETQARLVRGVLENQSGSYQPGMFITGEVVLEEVSVPIAVDASAVRNKGGQSIVFVEEKNRFTPRAVKVGRRDRASAEILAGLVAGERYASGNTFIVQAEIEKGEAEHSH